MSLTEQQARDRARTLRTEHRKLALARREPDGSWVVVVEGEVETEEEARRRDYVHDVVKDAPPLSAEQVERIRQLLPPPSRGQLADRVLSLPHDLTVHEAEPDEVITSCTCRWWTTSANRDAAEEARQQHLGAVESFRGRRPC